MAFYQCVKVGGGGSGSLDAVETTSNAYAQLPQMDKDDPTKIYFLNDTQPSVIDTPIDQSTFALKVESQYHMSVAVTDGKLVSVYNYGSSVGACAFEPNAISATASKIKFKFTTLGSYDTAQSHAITVGVKANYQSSNWIFPTDTDWLVKKVYDTRNTSVDDYIDISGITTPCYLMICFHGWTVTFDEFLVEDVSIPTGDTEIRYKDIPYGNNGGGTGDVADVEVNGTSIVDPVTKIAEITSYKEVTESEYEAIPVAERESNGIAYFIKDLNNESVQGYPPLIYSDEEREIGVWRDGKPLYQKTFSYTPSSTISTITPIANLSSEIEIKDIQGVCINSQNSRVIPLSYSGSNMGTNFAVSASNVLQIEIYNDNWGTNYTFYPTIQYTKTTDTAGSGTWNSQGGIAHHYSTNETVVGTWIDGKPLYEKTIEFNTPLTLSTNWTHSGIIIQNLNNIISNTIIDENGQSTSIFAGMYSNNEIALAISANTISTVKYLTIQYTKTTD